MFMYNSYKDTKIELKQIKTMKNRFQLKPDQIRGRIDNIKLTFLYLGEKRT